MILDQERLSFGVLRLGGAFFLIPRGPLSFCRNEKESGAGAPHSKEHGK
jgi:hypothetical protein